MVRRIISDTFGNGTDRHLRICQIGYGISHPKLFDKGCKAAACIPFDEGAQVRLAVMEKFCKGGQRQCLVVVLDILKDQREIRSHLVIIELDSFAVIPDQMREKQMNPANAVIITEGISLIAL